MMGIFGALRVVKYKIRWMRRAGEEMETASELRW